ERDGRSGLDADTARDVAPREDTEDEPERISERDPYGCEGRGVHCDAHVHLPAAETECLQQRKFAAPTPNRQRECLRDGEDREGGEQGYKKYGKPVDLVEPVDFDRPDRRRRWSELRDPVELPHDIGAIGARRVATDAQTL